MEPAGIRRKVDDLGRVVIPAGIRRALSIGEGDELVVSLRDGQVVMVKPAERCTFCDVTEELSTFRDRAVCPSCLGALRALDRERTGEAPASFF